MIAITGHLNGIGKALAEKYPSHKGFDILNGYNINLDQNKIIEESLDCNIFINNAYSYDSQSSLLELWHRSHYNKNHIIVNISSLSADPNLNIETTMPHLREYSEHKKHLNTVSFNINESGSICKSIVIMPGIVDTQFQTPYDNNVTEVGIKYFSKIKEAEHLLNVSDVVNAVDIAISSFNSRCFISSITVSNL
jgi:hypothetical protein